MTLLFNLPVPLWALLESLRFGILACPHAAEGKTQRGASFVEKLCNRAWPYQKCTSANNLLDMENRLHVVGILARHTSNISGFQSIWERAEPLANNRCTGSSGEQKAGNTAEVVSSLAGQKVGAQTGYKAHQNGCPHYFHHPHAFAPCVSTWMQLWFFFFIIRPRRIWKTVCFIVRASNCRL